MKHTRLAPRVPRRALLVFLSFFVCLFFFFFLNSRDWLRCKGMTARCLFQMLSYVFNIDSPFGGNIHRNQSLSDVLTHCLFTCRFIRNLLYFYKPSSQRFCTVHISDPQARTFSEVGCLLIDFLLDGEDVRYNFCSKGSGVGFDWKASLSLNQVSHYLSMCLSVCLYKRGQVSKETVVLRRWVV